MVTRHHLYEALGAYATIEVIEPALLRRLLAARDPRGRAFASRIAGRWQDRLENPLDLLVHRVEDEDAQVRMEAVAAAAAIPSPQSITVVARAVNRPLDASMNYVFSQAVEYLRPHWEPALKRGQLKFDSPGHLVEVLRLTGGKNLIDDLRTLADSNDHDLEARTVAMATLVTVGGPEDVTEYGLDESRFNRDGTYDPRLHAPVLAAAVGAVRNRNLEPHGDPAEALRRLQHTHPELTTSALTLAGLWKVEQTRDRVVSIVRDQAFPIRVRAAAFLAVANLELAEGRDLLTSYAGAPHASELRAAAIEALVVINLQAAARLAVELLSSSDLDPVLMPKLLSAFLRHQGGAAALADSIPRGGLNPDAAKSILRSLFSTGRSDPVLLAALNSAIGSSGHVPEFNATYVSNLATNARQLGDATRGAVLFKGLACASCHKVGGRGGDVGPDLTSIGTTLSTDRIIEELLWPNRQIKEGYSTIRVVTVDGQLRHGYERRTRASQASGDVVIQELTSQQLITIRREDIEEQVAGGSPMTAGLTSVASKSQLLDLINYLSELGEIK